MEEGSLFCGLMAASYRAWAERERGSYLKAVRVEYVVKSGRPPRWPVLACAHMQGCLKKSASGAVCRFLWVIVSLAVYLGSLAT